MLIELTDDSRVYLTRLHEPGFEIAGESGERHFGAMQMFVSSLAMCTWSVLAAYGERIEADISEIAIDMRWQYAERPKRISAVEMDIAWPDVPDSRLDSVMRAAATCTLHRTLEHGLEIETMVRQAG